MAEKLFVTDIDGVLLNMDQVIIDWMEAKYKKTGLGRPNLWELEHAYGIPKRDLGEMWDLLWATPLPTYPESAEFLKLLKKKGFRVVALSNRKNGAAVEASLRDLSLTGLRPLLDEVVYRDTRKETKGTWVKEKGADYFLDDNFSNIYDVLFHSPATKCFLFDQPFNQSLDLAPPYERVFTYSGVLRAV